MRTYMQYSRNRRRAVRQPLRPVPRHQGPLLPARRLGGLLRPHGRVALPDRGRRRRGLRQAHDRRGEHGRQAARDLGAQHLHQGLPAALPGRHAQVHPRVQDLQSRQGRGQRGRRPGRRVRLQRDTGRSSFPLRVSSFFAPLPWSHLFYRHGVYFEVFRLGQSKFHGETLTMH